jgi:hypothetical protein
MWLLGEGTGMSSNFGKMEVSGATLVKIRGIDQEPSPQR